MFPLLHNRAPVLWQDDGGDGGVGYSETPTELNYNGLPDVPVSAGSTTMTNNGFDPSTGTAVVAPPTSLDLNAGIGTIDSGSSAAGQGTATSQDATGNSTNSVFDTNLTLANGTIAANDPTPVLQGPADPNQSTPWADFGKDLTGAASLASSINQILNGTGVSGANGKVAAVLGNSGTRKSPLIGPAGSSQGSGGGVSKAIKSAIDALTGGAATSADNAIQAQKTSQTFLVIAVVAILALLLFRR